MSIIHQNKNTTAPHTLSNFHSLTNFISVILNKFYSHCSGDWQIALTKQNFSGNLIKKITIFA